MAGDTNGFTDIFVRDLVAGQTTRVSVGPAGLEADADSGWSTGGTVKQSISADGRFVAFNSSATNLVTNDTNVMDDSFVHDRTSGLTTRISVGPLGVQGNNHSIDPQISADGLFVAVSSDASNLVPGDSNGLADGFVREHSA